MSLDREPLTGLYHFRNRELSAALGRWNKPDPMGFDAGDSNLYRTSLNSPVSRLDPVGLQLQPRPNDGPVAPNHVFISVFDEKAAGIYNNTRADACCEPRSITMTARGAAPYVTTNAALANPNDIWSTPWAPNLPGILVGDVIGGQIFLEWVIEFNTDPRTCDWGRNVITWDDSFITHNGHLVIFVTPGTIRDDTTPKFDFIVGNKVYMYDAPGSYLRSGRMLFEVWAESQDGETILRQWSYVDTRRQYYTIGTPNFIYHPGVPFGP